MSFGTLTFGTGAFSSDEEGAFDSGLTGQHVTLFEMTMSADAEVFHDFAAPSLVLLAYACDAFLIGGVDAGAKISPTAWVEDASTTAIWTPDDGVVSIPSNQNPEV